MPLMLAQSDPVAGREQVRTTAMASDGRAVGRLESGKVVFVAGALPGESVLVEIGSDRARHASGRTIEVLSPAPERVAPPCPRLAEGCGGCQWQHVSPGGQRALKEGMIGESLRRIGRLDDPPLEPTVELPPWSWRTTIRAGVTDGRAALRRGHSHELVPVRGCLIAHPLLVPLLEGPRYPGASTVVLRCGAGSGERLVAGTPAAARPGFDLPEDVGDRHFREDVGGMRWRVSAASFFQSRPDGAEALARLILAAAADVGPPGRAVDAYCGVGLFGGFLARTGWSVTAVEGSRASVADARTNLAGLPADVVRGDVRSWSAPPADLVVADPSREGLGRDGVGALAAARPGRLVLISCDVASLGRDAGLLAAAGYRLVSVTPVDMFPQTWHVEVVSVFDRAGA
jgi:23S rRNA (uracil1939-C5)-methyltransferase